jgi:hypothetical protein
MKTDHMIFYFNKFTESELDKNAKIVDIDYDYSEINRLILERSGPAEDNRSKLLGESLYNNYLYQLFVLEFINFLEKERNGELRKHIRHAIMETNFKKDISEFQSEIRELLKDFPNDYSLIQNQLLTFYYIHFNKNALLEQIETTVYDFDHITINRLRKLPKNELTTELKEIVKTFTVEKSFDTTNIKFPNIYLPCDHMQEEHAGFCDHKKLIINSNGKNGSLNELIDILATDIKDDLKARYLMSNIFTDTTVDYLSFAKYPTEIVTIYRLEL